MVTAIKAAFKPFDTDKGVAAPLDDGRPSQKFMAKAQAQITLGTLSGFCFMYVPNAASDSTSPSLVYAVGTFSAGKFLVDGAWKNAVTGDKIGAFGTISTVSTNTPYTANVLEGGDYEFSCVGAGLKFTYEGSELYRGGTLRYIYDSESAYNGNGADWLTPTVNGLIDFVNTSPNTIRQSLNKSNVVEVNATIPNKGYYEATSAFSTSYGPRTSFGASLGGASATTNFGVSPAVVGYYVNTSGASISFHVDIVEHWALSAPTIQSLQTPSYAHAPMSTHVAAVMANVRQAHAGAPNSTHASVATDTLKVMKSPLGHELLNVGIKAALA